MKLRWSMGLAVGLWFCGPVIGETIPPIGEGLEAQEMARISRDMDRARAEVRKQLDEIRVTWALREPVDKNQFTRWKATKENFGVSFSRYQELVQQMYLRALAQVDEYNKLAKEAEQVYVGVKGVFNFGSPLLPANLEERRVKDWIPKNWYDRIYSDGYNNGYKEGADFERLFRVPQACEAPR